MQRPSSSSIRAKAMACASAAHRLDAWQRSVAWFDRYLGIRDNDARRPDRFVLRRLAFAVPLLLLISFGVFALVHLAPGDPVRALLGIAAVRSRDPRRDPRANIILNDPFLVQYGKWLWQVVQGDLGRSITGNRPVAEHDRAIGSASRSSLSLISTFLVLGCGVLLGMLAALRRGIAARSRRGHVRRLRHLARRPSSPASSFSTSSASCSAGFRPSVRAAAFSTASGT